MKEGIVEVKQIGERMIFFCLYKPISSFGYAKVLLG